MASHNVLREQLLEMGFDEKLIGGALNLLKDKATLESVIESIDNGTAEAEAAKVVSGDQPTEEPKPLTEEEKEARKKALEEKIKQRRLELEEQEKEKERQREIQRRKDGKDMGKMKEEIEKMQRENFVASLKREKAEEKEARDRILRQIELDKAERKAKFSGTVPPPSVQKPSLSSLITAQSSTAKDGKSKLAIRLLDGTQLIQEFDSKELLSSVRAFIVTQKNIDYNITLGMALRPPFTEEDMEKPLHALGLVPNARIQVVKR